jgi:phosphate ABC transporter permease protein PstC
MKDREDYNDGSTYIVGGAMARDPKAAEAPLIDLRPLSEAGWRGLLQILRERWDRPVFFSLASVSIIALGLIIFFIFREAIPLFRDVSVWDFFGAQWRPTAQVPRFGAMPMIVGSALVTLGSMAVAIPVGLGSAAFIAEVAPGFLKDLAKSVLELLAGVPSVVYGFFGLAVVAPFLQSSLHLATGRTALTASVILGIMALPTIASLAEDAITAVPNSYREASAAVGATRWQTIWRVTMPAAFSGLIGAIILGLGRAVGETMAVLMVAGNSPQITGSFLKPVRTLTSGIALEMGETPFGSTHYHALFCLGALLLLITLTMNWMAEGFRGRLARKHGR